MDKAYYKNLLSKKSDNELLTIWDKHRAELKSSEALAAFREIAVERDLTLVEQPTVLSDSSDAPQQRRSQADWCMAVLQSEYDDGYRVANGTATIRTLLVIGWVLAAVFVAFMGWKGKVEGLPLAGVVLAAFGCIVFAFLVWAVLGFFEWLLRSNLDGSLLLASLNEKDEITEKRTT